MLLRSVYASTAPSGSALPGRICVGKWGRNKSVKQDYIINETTLRALPVTQKALGFDTVDLDFNHNTVPGSPAFKAEKEPRLRAGYGALEVVPGEGVFLNLNRYTPQGESALKDGQVHDLSPAIITNSAGEVIFMHSVALCRQGCTEGLEIQLNSADFGDLAARLQTHSADFSPKSSPTAKPTMDAKYKALLLLILGLPDTADDAAIEAAAKTLGTKLDTATSTAKDASTAVQTMSAELKRVVVLLEGNEKDRLLADAVAAGKLVPQSISNLPLEHFKKVVADLPAGVVPLERRTPKDIQTHSAGVLSVDSVTETEVNRQLGIKPAADKA